MAPGSASARDWSTSGRRTEEAIDHYQRLLRLNPNDNHGVRDPLAGLPLKTGDHAALEALLDKYDSKYEVTLLYARALLLFRKGGNSASSLKALRRALRANRHVPGMLLGRAPLPPLAPYYTPGCTPARGWRRGATRCRSR